MPLKKYQRYLVAIVPIILVLLIAFYFSEIVTYIVLAWILSMLGAPIQDKISPILGKTGAALVTLLSFSILTFALIWLVVPPIIEQARNFTTIDYEEVLGALEEPLNDWNDWLIDKGIIAEGPEVDFHDHADEDHNRSQYEVISIDSLINQDDSTRQNVNIVLQVNNDFERHDDLHPPTPDMSDSYIDRLRKSMTGFLNPARITQVLSSIFGAVGNALILILSVFFCLLFLERKGLIYVDDKVFSP